MAYLLTDVGCTPRLDHRSAALPARVPESALDETCTAVADLVAPVPAGQPGVAGQPHLAGAGELRGAPVGGDQGGPHRGSARPGGRSTAQRLGEVRQRVVGELGAVLERVRQSVA